MPPSNPLSSSMMQVCIVFLKVQVEEGEMESLKKHSFYCNLSIFSTSIGSQEKKVELGAWIAGKILAKTGRRITEAGTQAEMAAMTGACSTVDRGVARKSFVQLRPSIYEVCNHWITDQPR